MEENNQSNGTLSNFTFKLYTIVISIFLGVLGLLFGVFLFKTTEERNAFVVLSCKTMCVSLVISAVIALLFLLLI